MTIAGHGCKGTAAGTYGLPAGIAGCTRSGAVTQQRSIPPLIVNQRATTDTTIVNNRLRDLAVVRASHHRG
ncbi:MAG: hypothetical protein NTY67_01225, partial [Cyanobacteria bacterium]|nr:hypothetical protein [Cyanobacteriota bacterium]